MFLVRAEQPGRPMVHFAAVDQSVYDAIFSTYVVHDDPAALAFYLIAAANLVRPEAFRADSDFPERVHHP